MLTNETVVRSVGRDQWGVAPPPERSLERDLAPLVGSAQGDAQNPRSRASTYIGRHPLREPSEAVYAPLGEPQTRQKTPYEEQKGLHSAFP